MQHEMEGAWGGGWGPAECTGKGRLCCCKQLRLACLTKRSASTHPARQPQKLGCETAARTGAVQRRAALAVG